MSTDASCLMPPTRVSRRPFLSLAACATGGLAEMLSAHTTALRCHTHLDHVDLEALRTRLGRDLAGSSTQPRESQQLSEDHKAEQARAEWIVPNMFTFYTTGKKSLEEVVTWAEGELQRIYKDKV